MEGRNSISTQFSIRLNCTEQHHKKTSSNKKFHHIYINLSSHSRYLVLIYQKRDNMLVHIQKTNVWLKSQISELNMSKVSNYEIKMSWRDPKVALHTLLESQTRIKHAMCSICDVTDWRVLNGSNAELKHPALGIFLLLSCVQHYGSDSWSNTYCNYSPF